MPTAEVLAPAAGAAEAKRLALLTNSSLKDARACLRLYRFKHVDGYRPVADDAEALRFGILFHLGLEAWWKTATFDERAFEAAVEAMHAGAADPFDLARAEELMLGYHVRWCGDRYEVIAVERTFRVALVNPATDAVSRTWELAGKLDCLIRDGERRVMLLEHKTSTEDVTTGSDYWKRLRLDGQVSTYYVGAAEFEPAACLYDVAKRPLLRPSKATPPESRKYTKFGALYANQRAEDETPEEFRGRLREDIAQNPDKYFARAEVVRLDAELREAMADTWEFATYLRAAVRAGHFPRNVDACVRFGRTCAFFPVCSGEASLDDPALYQKAPLHPELGGKE